MRRGMNQLNGIMSDEEFEKFKEEVAKKVRIELELLKLRKIKGPKRNLNLNKEES